MSSAAPQVTVRTVRVSLSIQNVEVGLANLAAHPVGLGGEPRQGIGVLRPPGPPLARAGAALAHWQHAAITLKEVNNAVSRWVEGLVGLIEALPAGAASDCAADVRVGFRPSNFHVGQPLATTTPPLLRPGLQAMPRAAHNRPADAMPQAANSRSSLSSPSSPSQMKVNKTHLCQGVGCVAGANQATSRAVRRRHRPRDCAERVGAMHTGARARRHPRACARRAAHEAVPAVP